MVASPDVAGLRVRYAQHLLDQLALEPSHRPEEWPQLTDRLERVLERLEPEEGGEAASEDDPNQDGVEVQASGSEVIPSPPPPGSSGKRRNRAESFICKSKAHRAQCLAAKSSRASNGSEKRAAIACGHHPRSRVHVEECLGREYVNPGSRKPNCPKCGGSLRADQGGDLSCLACGYLKVADGPGELTAKEALAEVSRREGVTAGSR